MDQKEDEYGRLYAKLADENCRHAGTAARVLQTFGIRLTPEAFSAVCRWVAGATELAPCPTVDDDAVYAEALFDVIAADRLGMRTDADGRLRVGTMSDAELGEEVRQRAAAYRLKGIGKK